MDTCISHASAIMLLREARVTTGATLRKTRLTAVPSRTRGQRLSTDSLAASGFDSVRHRLRVDALDIISSSSHARSFAKGVCSHVCSSKLAPGSILRVSSQLNDTTLLVAGPALCILEAAETFVEQIAEGLVTKQIALARLVALCSEFCGTYSRDHAMPRTGECHYKLEQLTNTAEIKTQLGALSRTRGLALALEAVNLSFDNSASPIETLQRMMLCLPVECGGLGIMPAEMNGVVDKSAQYAGLVNFESMRADLMWRLFKVAIEHLGSEWHDRDDVLFLDAKRIQDYQTLGWVVHPSTFADVRSQAAFNRFALRVCSSLEERGYHGIAGMVMELTSDDAFLARQAALLSVLLPPVTRYDKVA